MKRHAPLALVAGMLIAGAFGCGRREAVITRPDDARTARIGVMTGSTGEAIAVARFPNARIKSFDDIMDAVTAMKSGQLDATLTGFPAALQVTKKNPDLKLLADALDSEDTAMAVKKGNAELLATLNRIIAELKADGTLESMKKRWFKPDLGPYEELSITLPEEGEPLKVGVSATREPFSFVDKDGRVTGHDGELARLIAATLGRPVKFFDMKFMALIPALDSGKIDVIMTGMTATAERRNRVDFSEPYYANAQVMIVRRAGADDEAATSRPQKLSSAESSFVARIASSFRSNMIQENRYRLILSGLRVTAIISVFATALGTLLGALVCFMRMSTRSVLNRVARAYIAILRGTPVLVVLMLVFYVVFASVDVDPVLVAVVAFGMNFSAYVAEIFRGGIEGLDKGQTEAGLGMGFTRFETFRYIVMPQMARRILPVYKGEFISLVKMTSIVGYIAVQDLTKASDIIRSRTFDPFFPLIMVAVLYFAISWVLTESLDYVERISDPKRRRKAAHA